jgi:peptidoglycan/LPS O-acetylase OafA/YrhL
LIRWVIASQAQVEAGVCADACLLESRHGKLKACSTQHLPALTGLRFFLALWVMLHHLTGRGQMAEAAALGLPGPLYELIRGGYMAVTTFFVLSGFVLARSYAEMRWDVRGVLRYAAGRVARVYPVYLLSLLAVAPFVAADRTPGRGPLLAAHALLVQGWMGSLPVNWNTPAWSLSCEMFFYLVFPVAAVGILRMGWKGAAVAAAATCVLTRVMLWVGVPDPVKPLIHLSDFLMGIAAARIFDFAQGRAGVWIYLPAFAASAALIARPSLLPPGVDLNSALRPLNAALLIGLALGGGMLARVLSNRVIVYLGKSSYAMYILHVPILWWYLRWHGASSAVYIALVIGVSAVVYGVFEEPANRWLRGRVHRAFQA